MNRPHAPGTGNSAFWWLVAVSALVRGAAAYGICCLALASYDAVRAHGMAAVWSSDPNLLPGLFLLAVTAVGIGAAAWSLGRSAWHTRGFARQVRGHLTAPSPRLAAAARRAGIGGRLVVLGAAAPFALTYGVLRPRVLLTTGLAATLSGAELAAVLSHEREHLRSRDPLKNVLARAIPARHFYLPALARLRERFTAGRELAADRAALASHGTGPLADALLKVTEGPAWAAASPSAAMSTGALLEARIAQLETGTEPPPPAAGRRPGLYTLAGGLLLGSATAWSAIIVAHYMPQCTPGLA